MPETSHAGVLLSNHMFVRSWSRSHGIAVLQEARVRAGNYYNGAQYVGILFLTFWILLSYLVPLSLFVTMEIVKFVLVSAPNAPTIVPPQPIYARLRFCPRWPARCSVAL